jgi:PAS domain S-box-containing protein
MLKSIGLFGQAITGEQAAWLAAIAGGLVGLAGLWAAAAARRAAGHKQTPASLGMIDPDELVRVPDVGVAVTNVQGRYVAANEAFAAMTGRSREQILTLSPRDIVDPAEHARIPEDAESLRRNGFISREYSLLHANGGRVRLLINGATLTTGGFIAFFRDVTDEKRRQESMQHDLRVVSGALDTLPLQIAVLDESGMMLTRNLAWVEASQNLDVCPDRSCEPGASYLLACERASTALGSRGVLAATLKRVIDRASTMEEVEYSCGQSPSARSFRAIIARDATQGHIVVAHEDRTCRRRAEEERDRERAFVESLLDSADALVVVLSPEGLILRANKAAEKLAGLPLAGLTAWETPLFSADRDALQRAFTSLLAGQTERPDDHTIRSPDGREHVVTWSMSAVRGGARQPDVVVATGLDVTERRRIQQELLQAQRMDAVGQLAGGIAHDFNNLLTAIFGHVALAKRSLPETHQAIASLERVESAAEQVARVIRSLLTFSRKAVYEPSPVRVNAILDDTLRLMRGSMPHSITVQCQPGPDDLWVNADRLQIQQVLVNLAINARDAMPTGGTLTMRASRAQSPAEPPAALIELTDTGRGMTQEVLARAFEPFFTTKPRENGTGLGLTVARRIASEHGGRVELHSAPGEGTRAALWLPTIPAPVGVDTSTRRVAGEVLLASARPYARQIITTALRSAGWSVREVADLSGLVAAAGESPRPSAAVIERAILGPEPDRSLRSLLERNIRTVVICPAGEPAVASTSATCLVEPLSMGQLTAVVAGSLEDDPQDKP